MHRRQEKKMEGSNEIHNMIKAWSSVFASLTYCYFVASKSPTGILRLLSLLPILFIFTLIPLNISSIHFGFITTGSITWLCCFRLFLFAFDQGPLSQAQPPNTNTSLLQFICIASLPVEARTKPNKAIGSRSSSTRVFATKVTLCALILKMVQYRQYMNKYMLFAMYGCHVYMLVEIIQSICALPARAILGDDNIEPNFNDPYLSTSLQDFWGRRWNRAITSILHLTIYRPIKRVCRPVFGQTCSSIMGLLSAFLVSGLMHQLIIFYILRASPAWEVTGFFVLHGVCTTLEITVKKLLGDKWKLHPAIARFLTLGVLAVTGYHLFFALVVKHQFDERMIREYIVFAKYIKAALLRPLRWICLILGSKVKSAI